MASDMLEEVWAFAKKGRELNLPAAMQGAVKSTDKLWSRNELIMLVYLNLKPFTL